MSEDLQPTKTNVDEKCGHDDNLKSSWGIKWYVIPITVLLFSVGYNYFLTLIAWYIQRSYIPDHILDHYIQNPLQDVSLKIPVRYDVPFKFVDIEEAVDIQAFARFHDEFNTLVNVTIELIKSSEVEYHEGLYPESEIFINCKLSDLNALQVDGYNNYGELYFTLETVNQNDLPFFFTQIVIDHCFKNEIEKYSPDSFYKIQNLKDDDYYFVHEDEIDQPIITELLNKNYTEQFELILHYHVVYSDLIDFDIKTAILQHTIKILNEAPNFFKLSIYFDNITTEDLKNIENDDEFDINLSQISILPCIKNILKNAAFDDNSNKQHVHFIFHPVTLHDETFEKLASVGLNIDSSDSNFILAGNWSSVYFPLLEELNEDGKYEISDKMTSAAFWRFDEALLDSIGIPDENLSPHIRIEAFKRFMTIQNLTKLSSLLFNLKRKLKKDNLSVWKIKEIAELFTESLILREQAIEALRNKKTFEALTTSSMVVDKINMALNY